MEPRKIIITIEALSNIPLKEFCKVNIQEMFNENFTNLEYPCQEIFTVHQVRAQVVKENK